MSGIRGGSVAAAVLAIMVLPVLAGSASAASYAWTLSCKVDGYYGGTAVASWDWLQDGQVIAGAGGTTGCGGSGGGDRPANATGIAVSLSATASTDCGGKTQAKEVAKSFETTGSFQLSFKVSASISCTYTIPLEDHHPGWPSKVHEQSSIDATFTMTG